MLFPSSDHPSLPRRANSRRSAATMVEATLVITAMLMFLMGIFEYCRFVFVLQIAENAAREGARYATPRTADGTTLTDVQTYVTSKMVGRQSELVGYAVSVENVYPDTGLPVPNTAWNDAPFGGAIKVSITGTFRPLLPSFLKLPTSIPVTATSMMSSEAN